MKYSKTKKIGEGEFNDPKICWIESIISIAHYPWQLTLTLNLKRIISELCSLNYCKKFPVSFTMQGLGKVSSKIIKGYKNQSDSVIKSNTYQNGSIFL